MKGLAADILPLGVLSLEPELNLLPKAESPVFLTSIDSHGQPCHLIQF